MKTEYFKTIYFVTILALVGCQTKKEDSKFQAELKSVNLMRGDIALCGATDAQFGKVEFGLSCDDKVRSDFNLATALLHSFEYPEAEKVFAKVIDQDPSCLMAYWGVAMSNFHPLWAPPTKEELEKGSKVIALARSLKSTDERESDYLEAVAVMYDDWNTLSHQVRVQKFEKAAENIYQKYPSDNEAAIFYALALRAASDPTDKTFVKQRKAGEILNSMFTNQPDHPGIAHYLIHVYDYPELAEMALPAARKYAAIAASSAHALHMPSHIFTRLGLWDEAIQSNINSMTAAKCYAENSGMKGHWDEEIHGLDYLVYAYLQQGRDDLAKAQMDYLQSMDLIFPMNNKVAYTSAAVPTRYALERHDWASAVALELKPENFPWKDYPWERSIISFGRMMGAVHLKNTKVMNAALQELKENHEELVKANKTYEAYQVKIQLIASEAWMQFYQGKKAEAIKLMTEAADLEDATDKHPVTPGEVVPARELLADMLLEAGDYKNALLAYEADLKRHPQRFNGLYGAGLAAQKTGDTSKSKAYFEQLMTVAQLSAMQRPVLSTVKNSMKEQI
jgi:tetratricopeptide (TPR) repeat protein